MDPIDLAAVKRFTIQPGVVNKLVECLDEGRNRGCEALSLLAGFPVTESEFMVDACYVPAQRATSISVDLEEGSLLAIHENLAASDRALAIQVHSHPGDAYHSDEDDADTTMTQNGSLSIVVPEFGARGLNGWTGCAVYRRVADGWSLPLDQREVHDLLEVEDEQGH